VIEDAACAAGSEILWGGRWERIGRPHGDVACFSFHPRKVMSTGDGGMLTARDPELDRRFRLLRQHGMSVPDTVRHKADQVIFESYESLGFNYRMTDIQAAVGREQLRRLPGILARRRELAARYSAGLARVEEIAAPREAEWARSNWQSYCVRLAEGSDQRAIMQVLLERGISTRRGIMCAHREPAYRVEPWTCGKGPGACGCREGSCRRLAQSEAATDGSLLLPLYSLMTDEDQDAVIAAVGEALCHGKR
jgi:dTDP-4-amino-4,6-dideoxygalactose transaminase